MGGSVTSKKATSTACVFLFCCDYRVFLFGGCLESLCCLLFVHIEVDAAYLFVSRPIFFGLFVTNSVSVLLKLIYLFWFLLFVFQTWHARSQGKGQVGRLEGCRR